MARATIADVARRAGVSKGLVSLALNDRPGVSAETRTRIQRIAEDMDWRPNPAARGLSAGRAFALGLVVHRERHTVEVDPFFASFIAGVEEALSQDNRVLVLSVVTDADTEAETYRRLSKDRRVDGFLLTDFLTDDHRVALLRELDTPAVILGDPAENIPFPVVSRDYARGVESLLAHLAELGHRRIAHVTGDLQMQHASRRRDHFLTHCRALGLEALIAEADFSPERGAQATVELLDGDHRPTAIVYANDPMAIAGIAVAHERGLNLPADLSVAGMDGSDIGRYTYPSLTTLNNDPAGWGRQAAAVLLELIEQGEAADAALPGADLIIRGSTGAPA
ncbi:LacI family transcriptional regulator [Agromyces mediolanus]|uniref:LacI family DNA-binding transcriptional regulator n=1 Tax=Agromyces mediolanus TaxID=41986 RepID=UPI00203CC3E9|nr:LacI family DNA-binding transcriptional regulator [Agromyces mediolanus]MCM3658183.1 LacI family transcriptional regulator [Agromyces mediolanus]